MFVVFGLGSSLFLAADVVGVVVSLVLSVVYALWCCRWCTLFVGVGGVCRCALRFVDVCCCCR